MVARRGRRGCCSPSSRSRPGARTVPPAIAFTLAGLVIGTAGLGWIDVTPDAESLKLLAEATLALVLFADASRIDLRALRDGYALRRCWIGLPLTIVAGTLAALVVLPELAWEEALVLDDRAGGHRRGAGPGGRPTSASRCRCGRGSTSSGLNDGLLGARHRAHARGHRRGRAQRRIGGRARDRRVDRLRRADGRCRRRRRGRSSAAPRPPATRSRPEWRFLLTLVAAGLAYGLAAPLGGSGFIASFVAGMIFGGARRARRDAPPLPAQDLGALLNAVTFIAFGAAFMRPLLERATWQIALRAAEPDRGADAAGRDRDARYAVEPGDRRVPRLVRPRGLASIVFAVLVVDAGIPHTSTIVDAAADGDRVAALHG